MVKEVLKNEYMSSEESDYSDGEAGPVFKGYLVKKLPWERSRFTKIKKELDLTYLKHLPTRSRGAVMQRSNHSTPSLRPVPLEPKSFSRFT